MEKPDLTKSQTTITTFRYWTQRVLPIVYDESLSYVELLYKVIKHLNDIGEQTNILTDLWNDAVEWLLSGGLKEEVEKKLDQMAEDGTLDKIINEHIFEDLNTKIGDPSKLGRTPMSLVDMLSSHGVSPFHFGAFGDGNPHYLYEQYSSLQEAQADYPVAKSLQDQVDWCALQMANDRARDTQQRLYLGKAYGRAIFIINREIKAQTTDNQEPVVWYAPEGKGSFFRPRNTTTIRRHIVQNETGYERLFYGVGHGLELYNITFDGQNTRFDGVLIDRGFELVMQSIRILNVWGRGLELNNLSNAYLNRVYVDHCGDDGDGVGAYRPAVIITGKDVPNVNEKVSNSVLIDFMHIERSRSTSLQVATGNSYVQKAEFITFNKLHIEQTIDNVEQTTYMQRPVLHVGNGRGIDFISAFIYGGGKELVRIQKWMPVGADNDKTSVTFVAGEIKGYTTGGATTDNTPDILFNIESGDYVGIFGTILAHVRQGGTHLKINSVAGTVQNLAHINDTLGGTAKIADSRVMRKGLLVPVIDDANNPALLGSIYIEQSTGKFRAKDLNGINIDL